MANSFNVTAIVLAGGTSKRMGKTNKLLTELNGTPLVRRVVKLAIASKVIETIVVTGFESEKVCKALSGYSVKFVHNPSYQNGLSTSLISGINAISKNIAGAVVMLSDMPWVMIKTMNMLIEQFQADQGKTICRPTYNGFPGNPVLWPKDMFPKIMNVRGDMGARDLIEDYSKIVTYVDVDDEGILVDINKPNDLKFEVS